MASPHVLKGGGDIGRLIYRSDGAPQAAALGTRRQADERRSMKRVLSVFGLAAVLAVGAGLLHGERSLAPDALSAADDFQTCAPVSGVPGPEDLQIDAARRRIFVSSFDRTAPSGGARGAIYVFSLDDPLAADSWRDRTAGIPEAFEPVGIYYYDDGETRRLFAANAAARAIELYDVSSNGDLRHLETFVERRMTSPNDVVAVGPRAFYVTNDAAPGRDSLLGRLHYLLGVASGRILHFDGVAWRAAAEGLRFANGIALSPDGGRLYAAETAARGVRIYDRDAATGALAPAMFAPMGAPVRNINTDGAGALWIAASRPAPPSRGEARTAGATRALVLRYDDMTGFAGAPKPVFAGDGRALAAPTAAARLGKIVVIGGALEQKFLICDLPA